jgi:serine/threonine protein kinase
MRMKTHDPMTGLVGTSHWMAPEVLLSSPSYDENVNVFSFGIVLISRRPYEHEQTQVAFIVNVTQKNVRPDSCPAGRSSSSAGRQTPGFVHRSTKLL